MQQFRALQDHNAGTRLPGQSAMSCYTARVSKQAPCSPSRLCPRQGSILQRRSCPRHGRNRRVWKMSWAAESGWFEGTGGGVGTKLWLPSVCYPPQLDSINRLDTRHSKPRDTVRVVLLAKSLVRKAVTVHHQGFTRMSCRDQVTSGSNPQQRRPIPIAGSAATSSNGARFPWGCSGAVEG
jgi:hypothetical protein